MYQLNSRIMRCFKDGDIETARRVFDEMPHKNVVTWNCMISGYVRNKMIREAGEVFDTMPSRNVVSWTAMLNGYAKSGRLEEARNLFDQIHNKNIVCWNSMISGYIFNGRMDVARELFDAMPIKNTVSWVIVVEGYFRYGMVQKAKELFNHAPVKNVSLYNALLCGYVEIGSVEASWELFMGMPERDVASWTTMITGFSRAGKMENARGLFEEMPKKDVIAWTAMIQGYLHNNLVEDAQKLFNKMPHRDTIAWNSMIGGHIQNGRFEDALELFMKMPRLDIVSWNSILQGYVQQDDMITASNFFNQMPHKDETSWNIMITGYQSDESFILFSQMLGTGFKPDQGTLTSVISVCGALAAHGWGRSVHLYVIKIGYENDTAVSSSLISMYSKCGFVNDAALVFEKMINRDTVAWNAIIVAQACHGFAVEALKLFLLMIDAGVTPDHVTFLGILTACGHAGLVDEGWKYFKAMENDRNLIPKPEHYACMVDLLGRSGLIAEAYELVIQLPVDLPAYTWEALLSSCRVHENFGLGKLVAQKLTDIQSTNVGILSKVQKQPPKILACPTRSNVRHEYFVKLFEGYLYRFITGFAIWQPDFVVLCCTKSYCDLTGLRCDIVVQLLRSTKAISQNSWLSNKR
ncbi:pentatricopeptide repeat (PPR) superfamily protein [Actinidia rufa]|uniref:Pentatricopeptide repeat (PPR) superfamily protein n=1 Tax=Actinidia rufa TaxID=165716 RepID=A0A7J0F084_9ERIC|nr:pentatricopeptide repeat (PPR) superfamily protein [Actinidia rufa]